jgi:hypothetical protein
VECAAQHFKRMHVSAAQDRIKSLFQDTVEWRELLLHLVSQSEDLRVLTNPPALPPRDE